MQCRVSESEGLEIFLCHRIYFTQNFQTFFKKKTKDKYDGFYLIQSLYHTNKCECLPITFKDKLLIWISRFFDNNSL